MRYAVAIIIVLILGGVIYYTLYSKNNYSNETASSTPNGQTSTIEYRNNQYGFSINLPTNWQGFAVQDQKWTGQIFDKNGVTTQTQTGPQVSITAPPSLNIGQNIPIMIFTKDEWNLIMAGAAATSGTKFLSVSAAPIPPSKLGENSKYVFALPPRYNYAFPPGYETVEQIVASNTPLQTF